MPGAGSLFGVAEIGATLREARMRARIDINEVERRTKIRAKYLRALENEEWDLLPGEVYVKSFLRTYSSFLGVDSRQLLDEYKRRYERPSDHEARPITPRSRERERRPPTGGGGPPVPPWALIGVVLVAVVVALYFVGRHKPGSASSTTATHSATNHRHRASSRSGHRTAPRHARATPTRVRLQLVPTGQVYVCVVDQTGKPLIDGHIYNAGDSIPTQTAPKLMLTLGNASVHMKVNGKPLAVVPSAGSIGYELTPTGHKTLSAAQQPRCA